MYIVIQEITYQGSVTIDFWNSVLILLVTERILLCPCSQHVLFFLSTLPPPPPPRRISRRTPYRTFQRTNWCAGLSFGGFLIDVLCRVFWGVLRGFAPAFTSGCPLRCPPGYFSAGVQRSLGSGFTTSWLKNSCCLKGIQFILLWPWFFQVWTYLGHFLLWSKFRPVIQILSSKNMTPAGVLENGSPGYLVTRNLLRT